MPISIYNGFLNIAPTTINITITIVLIESRATILSGTLALKITLIKVSAMKIPNNNAETKNNSLIVITQIFFSPKNEEDQIHLVVLPFHQQPFSNSNNECKVRGFLHQYRR